jgi:hypothetical protein
MADNELEHGGEQTWPSVEVESGSPDAFLLIHDPLAWLNQHGIEAVAGKKIKGEIVNHEYGLRKRIIRVTPTTSEAGDVRLRLEKLPPNGDGPEAIGYKLKGVDD